MSYSASTNASAARHIFFPVTTFPPQIEIQWRRSQVGPDFSRPCESCKGTYRSQDVSLSSCTFYTTFDPRELKSFLGKKSCTHKHMGFGHFPVLRTTESPSSWSKTVHVFRTCTTLCLYITTLSPLSFSIGSKSHHNGSHTEPLSNFPPDLDTTVGSARPVQADSFGV